MALGAAGFFLGTAALVKPIGQVVVLAFLLGWIVQEKRRATGLLFLLSYLACVAPWIIRNYQQQGLATPSTVGRSTFTFMSERPVHIPSRLRTFSGSELNKEVTRISNEWIGQTLTSAERKHAMEQKALVLIAQHWPTVAYQTAVGVLRTCLGPGSITVLNSIAR